MLENTLCLSRALCANDVDFSHIFQGLMALWCHLVTVQYNPSLKFSCQRILHLVFCNVINITFIGIYTLQFNKLRTYVSSHMCSVCYGCSRVLNVLMGFAKGERGTSKQKCLNSNVPIQYSKMERFWAIQIGQPVDTDKEKGPSISAKPLLLYGAP